eukprot:scaffold33101_cov64-Phaeocystis_antarctica.AAC.2
MLHGFEALDSRIHRTHGRRCVEPPGQDGYNCLLLAAIDPKSEFSPTTQNPSLLLHAKFFSRDSESETRLAAGEKGRWGVRGFPYPPPPIRRAVYPFRN